jgi:8-amino-7-oxononanoate synthase
MLPKTSVTRLKERETQGNLRQLTVTNEPLVDLCSNDYLGFSTFGALSARLHNHPLLLEERKFGSTGSRLLSGNSLQIEALEARIATFHGVESALFFSTGYAANSGIIQAFATRHDTVLYDERAHASIIDGARSSFAKNIWSFRHNDLEDLRKKIGNASGDVYVITESVFSMDGDFAPLEDIIALCDETNSYCIVDEAHAFGLFGRDGNGRVYELGLEKKVLANIVTFGKALGAHGAAVLCGQDTKQFLINFCRPFIYSTAPDFHLLAAIDCGYSLLQDRSKETSQLFFLIHEFRNVAKKYPQFTTLDSLSAIQGIILGSNQRAKQASEILRKAKIDARAILSPTVAAGSERLRICLHTFNTPPEIQAVFYELSQAAL